VECWCRFFPAPAKSAQPGSQACDGSSIFASSWAPTSHDTFWPLYYLRDSAGRCLPNATYVPAEDVTRSYLNAAVVRLEPDAPGAPEPAASAALAHESHQREMVERKRREV
jgi:hypothetical protein